MDDMPAVKEKNKKINTYMNLVIVGKKRTKTLRNLMVMEKGGKERKGETQHLDPGTAQSPHHHLLLVRAVLLFVFLPDEQKICAIISGTGRLPVCGKALEHSISWIL